jgi:hypothetical protein
MTLRSAATTPTITSSIRNRRPQNFDRSRPAQSGIGGAIHFTHTTRADNGQDLIRTEL